MKFIKTTIIGGLVFLVPAVVVFVVLDKAATLMRAVAEPLARIVPVGSIGGIATANVIVLLSILLVCFLAGLAARTAVARMLSEKVEAALLGRLPGYALIKGFASSLSPDDERDLKPVLVRLDDHERIGLEVEALDEGRRVVYFPNAPNAWAGTVQIVRVDRIQRLDVPMTDVIAHAELIGKRSARLLSKRAAGTSPEST